LTVFKAEAFAASAFFAREMCAFEEARLRQGMLNSKRPCHAHARVSMHCSLLATALLSTNIEYASPSHFITLDCSATRD
jgi:hypothetical protein